MSIYLPTGLSSMTRDVFNRQIDRVFDEALRAFEGSDQVWVPACNAWEDDDGFYMHMALPGWEQKNIALEVNNQVLTMRGERKDEVPMVPKCHVHEITDGRFSRIFKLPTFVDHDKASATHKNGLLTITFPKQDGAKCRRIVIEGQ
jgi:HSP20 family protein